jgi:hypothetical protein
MAVINTIDDALSHPQSREAISGSRLLQIVRQVTIQASDDDTSVWFLGEVPDTAIVSDIELEGAAITGATDYDIGLYKPDGTVIDVDVFADGLDLSSIAGLPVGPFGDGCRKGMTNLAVTDANKTVSELAVHVNKAFPAVGETSRLPKYRIGLRANTAGSGAGALVARITYLMAF